MPLRSAWNFIAACILGFALLANPGHTSVPATIIFGGDLDYPPFERAEDGRPVGFHIDVELALGRAGERTVRHRLGPWPEIVEALRTGEVDVVPMLKSAERERFFWFSEPIHFASHAIFTSSDPGNVTQLSELRGWRVVVERSSYAHDRLLELGHEADRILVANTREAVQALGDGQADYAILVTGPATRLAHSQSLDLQRVGMPLWPQEYAFAVRKDRPDLIAWVETNLERVVANGEFQRIRERWEDDIAPATSSPYLNGWTKLAAALLVALLVWSIWMAFRLRRANAAEQKRRAIAEGDTAFLFFHDSVTRLPKREKFHAAANDAIKEGKLAAPADLLIFRVLNCNRIVSKHGSQALEDYVLSLGAELESFNLPAGHLAATTFSVLVESYDTHLIVEKVEAIGLNAYRMDQPRIAWGAARIPDHGHDVGEVFDKAEIALAGCIARGMKFLVYDHSLEPSESDLSLIRDFEEFGCRDVYVEYQPQLDLNSGQISAAEALIRWDHPEQGLIPPSRFIPLLEGVGLVSLVTRKAVHDTLQQSARFDQLGIPCRFSINVSVHDMLEGDLPGLFLEQLRRTGAKARNILVELTESGAVEEHGRVKAVAGKLRDMGIRTAIDDFGTGFATLANLTEIPFDEIKIDQLFVSQMLHSPGHRSAVRSVIDMAHDMGLEVVAEGVSAEAMLDLLRDKGCDRAQGYAISAPVSADDLIKFVLDWSKCAKGLDRGHVVDFPRSSARKSAS